MTTLAQSIRQVIESVDTRKLWDVSATGRARILACTIASEARREHPGYRFRVLDCRTIEVSLGAIVREAKPDRDSIHDAIGEINCEVNGR